MTLKKITRRSKNDRFSLITQDLGPKYTVSQKFFLRFRFRIRFLLCGSVFGSVFPKKS